MNIAGLNDLKGNGLGEGQVYYYNFEKPETTHILAEVMNFMGYDAGAVGNHDIETGHPVCLFLQTPRNG